MERTETVTAGELKRDVFVLDSGEWFEVVGAETRFGVVRLTVEDADNRESVWFVPADAKITIER